MRKNYLVLSLFILILMAAMPANASTFDNLVYQGTLLNSEGEPIDGTLTLTFRIYESENSGYAVWEETQDVKFTDGVFSVQLGSKESLSEDLFLSETLYLGMQIEDDDELSPRAGLFSVPTAFYAQKATVAESLADGLVITPDQILDGGITTAKISSGAVGSTQLSSTGVTAGTYGSANQVAQITVDSKGRITSATNINLTASGSGDLTGLIAGTGLTGGGDSGDITLNVNVGTGANQIVQLDGSAKLPAVDGSLLTNITPANNSVTSGKIAMVQLAMPISVILLQLKIVSWPRSQLLVKWMPVRLWGRLVLCPSRVVRLITL